MRDETLELRVLFSVFLPRFAPTSFFPLVCGFPGIVQRLSKCSIFEPLPVSHLVLIQVPIRLLSCPGGYVGFQSLNLPENLGLVAKAALVRIMVSNRLLTPTLGFSSERDDPALRN